MFTGPWWTELAIQLLIAVLTTLLGMLTYDRAVARPRASRTLQELHRHEDRTG